MKRKLLLSISLWLLIFPAFSQIGSYNNWIFGTYVGLNFNGGAPVKSAGAPIQLKSQEACASISDNSGNLLMYSDGLNLWDGTNTLRTSSLLGAESGAQGIMIIPFPGSTTKFYLFTGSVDPGSGGIGQPNKGVNYQIVDISAATWTYTAAVNLVSASTATEHLTAVSDGVGGFWIVSHLNTNGGGAGDNRIVSFHFNASGVNDIGPVTSSAGGAAIVKWIGTAKANSCGNRIAFTYYDAGVVELYAFDNSTSGVTAGKVTSLVKSLTVPTAYGLEFSPDDKLLYYTNLGGNKLYQYNIAGNSIFNDPTWISSNELSEMAQLQLGPDSLIYVAESSNGGQPTIYLGAIKNPNTVGLGANYNGKQITISTTNGSDGYPFRGLPDFYRTLLVSSSIKQYPVTGGYCISTGIPLSYVYAGSVASQTWTVTPGVLGTDYTYTSGSGTTANPTINFATAGTYKVKLAITDNCAHVYLDSMTYTITAPKIPAGTITCGTSSITLTATGTVSADYPNYVWYDAASGGNILGVGSPVTLNYPSLAAAPTSVWVEVAGSATVTSSGSNTAGPSGTSWSAGAVSQSNSFTVLANSLTVQSIQIATRQGSTTYTGSFTVTITNSSSVTVFTQSYTVPSSASPPVFTANINQILSAGTYTITVASGGSEQFAGTSGWAGVTNTGQISLASGNYVFGTMQYNYSNYSITTTCTQLVKVDRHCLTISPGDGTYCTGVNIPLSYTFEGTVSSQSWTISPGVLNTDWKYTSGNSSSASPTIQFMTAGTYTVTVAVTDITSTTYSKSMTFTVIASVAVAGTVSCSTPNLVLDNPASDPNKPNYIWYANSVAPSNIIGTGTPLSYPIGVNGTEPSQICIGLSSSAPTATVTTGKSIASSVVLSQAIKTTPYTSQALDVLANRITLKSVDVSFFGTSGSVTYTLTVKQGATTVFAQSTTATAPGAVTIPINTTLMQGTGYTFVLTSSPSGLTLLSNNWSQTTNANEVTYYDQPGGANSYTDAVANIQYDAYNYTTTPGCALPTCIPVACTLPIELLDFTGTGNGSKNYLNWTTAIEINNAYFEIQKSTDNMNFETIGKISGKGNSNSIQSYYYTDNNVTGTITYYRLIQYDFDGKTTVSSIISINTNSTSGISVAPNPSHDAFNAVISEITTSDLTVFDVLGREIYSTHIAQGRSLVTFGADFQSGAYILQIKTADQVFIQRIIKE